MQMIAVYDTLDIPGILGAIVAAIITTILLTWLTARAQRNARMIGGRKILAYGLSVRVFGWILLLISLFIVYGALRASASQIIIAWCVGIAFSLMGSAVVLEFHFIRILFDDEFIYTFSPWRPSRKIPWTAISGYAFSDLNKWYILKTTSYGNIRLSILLSGLGTFSQELEKRKIRFAK